jgi:hypothetical protein
MNTAKREKELFINWKRLLNYQSLVRQVPFFLFVTMLAVVYIYNGHLADKTMRSIIRSSTELKELQNEYKSVKGDALLRSRQSEMAEAVKSIGLNELVEQPAVLFDSSSLVNKK